MNRALHSASKVTAGSHCACLWTIAVFLCAVAPSAAAQVQQSGSLADAARQARAQKQAQPQADVSTAQQVADELSEEQNHTDTAPAGFKTYNAGDYTLWVPAPYTAGGHDNAGIVLSGPMVGSKRTLLLVGNPILLPLAANDDAFRDAATQFSHLYSATATCSKTSSEDRSAYECSLAAADLIGMHVSGNTWFLRSANTIYPVFCAAPSDSYYRDYVNNPRAILKEGARAGLAREDQDMRNVWQKCDAVFQSIRVKEVTRTKTAKSGPDQPESPVQNASSQPGKSDAAARAAATGGPASLADIARQLKQDPAQAVVTNPAPAPAAAVEGSTVPAGFRVQAFQYCAGVRQCWDASVLVPADAQLISSDCKQYAFELKVQGSPFLLMAGPAGGACDGRSANDASLIRWKELVDPDSRRAPGTYSTISSQTRKLDGKAAAIITIGFRKGLTEWMGKRAEVEDNGIQVVVGCMAPREHFADGDAVCSALIESLRLP